jgi:transketolase
VANGSRLSDDLGVRELERWSNQIRIESLKCIYNAKSGHPGGSLSSAEILAVLYFDKMRIDPHNPLWPERDRFIMSKGHAAPGYYAALALRGYFPVSELATLRQFGSRLQGHPDMNKTPGVDMTSGSLGQGLSIGLGMALAARVSERKYRTYVLMGDGEVQEGQVWEAAMAASHMKVSRLIAIVDYNNVQLDGFVSEVMDIAPLAAKWRAFGWEVVEINGHAVGEVSRGLDLAIQLCEESPVVIIAKTVKGKGVSFMENKAQWHGSVPNEDEYQQAMNELSSGC